MPDWDKLEAPGGALRDRLAEKKHLERTLSQAIPADILEQQQPATTLLGGKEGFALWVRMLFSCLVDADFLDTEEFMDSSRTDVRGNYPTLTALRGQFNTALENMFEHDRSAARGEMATRGLYVFKHDNALGRAKAHELFSRVSAKLNGNGQPPREFSDYEVTIDDAKMPEGVELMRKVG